MTENSRPGAAPHPTPEAFFATLQEEIAAHPALSHPFLIRFSVEPLSITQLRTFAVQHYMYSRFFTRNLAAVISNTPDEQARSLLIMNMYEEIGEPMKQPGELFEEHRERSQRVDNPAHHRPCGGLIEHTCVALPGRLHGVVVQAEDHVGVKVVRAAGDVVHFEQRSPDSGQHCRVGFTTEQAGGVGAEHASSVRSPDFALGRVSFVGHGPCSVQAGMA